MMTNLFNDMGLEEALTFVLTVDDKQFDRLWPEIQENFQATIASKEFEEEIANGAIGDKDRENIVQNLLQIRQSIEENKDEFSKNKREYLLMMIDAIEGALEEIPSRNSVEVSVELCRENAKLPTYAHPSDAGCDVYAVEDSIIMSGETKIIPTGLKMAIPNGWMVSVRPRSGLSAKTGLRIANAPGTIDTSYRNEVGIIITNTGDAPYRIQTGDRIAQFIIEPAPMIKFLVVDSVEKIGENRNGGYGSTGN